MRFRRATKIFDATENSVNATLGAQASVNSTRNVGSQVDMQPLHVPTPKNFGIFALAILAKTL
ncbi:hypothetical protein E4U59_007440 [Claviceps monticola]|nr:hypothetical protein E4U59_007440 [Claviceps monticola]